MDQGKILLVNLAKGKIGEDTTALLSNARDEAWPGSFEPG